MIISKYSGNVVGYLDYYTTGSRRVQSVNSISRVQKLKWDKYSLDKSESAYVRFCREQVPLPKIAKSSNSLETGHSSCRPAVLYTCKGKLSPAYKIGCFVNITV